MTERRVALATWPRLLDIHLAALYLSIGESTLRDWIACGLLHPVEMPGSTLRDRHGNEIAKASRRRIAKILISRGELDQLVDRAPRKGAA